MTNKLAEEKAMSDQTKQDLFTIAQKFSGDTPHPTLINKYIKQLEQKDKQLVKANLIIHEIQLEENVKSIALKTYLEIEIEENLKLKLAIFKANNYQQLHACLIQLFTCHIVFLKKIQSYLPDKSKFEDEHLKLSDPFNYYEILKQIDRLNRDENEIKNYLCKEIIAKKLPYSRLLNGCLRANKILANGR